MSYLDEEDLAGHARAWKDHLKAGEFYSTVEIIETLAELQNAGVTEIQLINLVGITVMQGPTGRKITEWQQ